MGLSPGFGSESYTWCGPSKFVVLDEVDHVVDPRQPRTAALSGEPIEQVVDIVHAALSHQPLVRGEHPTLVRFVSCETAKHVLLQQRIDVLVVVLRRIIVERQTDESTRAAGDGAVRLLQHRKLPFFMLVHVASPSGLSYTGDGARNRTAINGFGGRRFTIKLHRLCISL